MIASEELNRRAEAQQNIIICINCYTEKAEDIAYISLPIPPHNSQVFSSQEPTKWIDAKSHKSDFIFVNKLFAFSTLHPSKQQQHKPPTLRAIAKEVEEEEDRSSVSQFKFTPILILSLSPSLSSSCNKTDSRELFSFFFRPFSSSSSLSMDGGWLNPNKRKHEYEQLNGACC